MTTLAPLPARIRFTNTDGTLTPEAYRQWQVLFTRVGGTLGDNGTDIFADLTGGGSQDASITDTVTQPGTPDDTHDSINQSASTEHQALSDVLQAAVLEMLTPDVVQPSAIGYNGTITTALLVGKTIMIQNGIITGFQ
jgi:hypothetical protein